MERNYFPFWDIDKHGHIGYSFNMKNISREIELFKQKHPDVAKAMEIFQMSMDDYKRAYSFINEPRTYTSNTTTPSEKEPH